ncbi:MAG: sterol desaturase family protein [Planctomycetes bacterium]|nr:sterol desaturase family protein [Planctomycetota bacterium]
MAAPRWLTTDEPHRFGSGWISGTIGAIAGLAAAGTALCLALPDQLTTPALRGWYPLPWVRAALATAIGVAFALGAVSLALRRKPTLGLVAVGAALAAAGLWALAPAAPVADGTRPTLAVDVFVLNLLLYSALFVPLERLWPLRRDQPTFRPDWWTDFAWFVSSALLVQVTTFLVLGPAESLAFAAVPALQSTVRALPLALQFAAIVLVADLVQYWVHRACHRVPWLWRCHAIHHSAEAMDWLAGSRLHTLDAVLTRALVYAPLFVLGFAPAAIGAYLVFVAAQATFVHANVGWRLGWLEPWLVTPRFHHWHHAEAPLDTNFAVHLPWLDRLFGTWHLPPAAWPASYGLGGNQRGPRGFWRQLAAPFAPRGRP